MLRYAGVVPMVTLVSVLIGCSADRSWQNDFRFGLATKPYTRHELIPQYFDSANERGEKFYLYYFTNGPRQKSQRPVKTILFCAGGPGEVFWPEGELWLRELEEEHRVVYFHLRGAGFSQFPESNKYDVYLRSKYAVRDIEQIFEDVKKHDSTFKKWTQW